MKTLPNLISITRIILSITLIFIRPLSAVFFIIYIICGLSDMIDGTIARSTGTTSKLGEKLDSIADLIMIGVLIYLLYPIINPPEKILIWIVLIGIIRVASVVVAMKKFKTVAILHTYGNKITGLMLFLFPMLLPYVNTGLLMAVICITASTSAIEELIIQITASELKVNRKSMFLK